MYVALATYQQSLLVGRQVTQAVTISFLGEIRHKMSRNEACFITRRSGGSDNARRGGEWSYLLYLRQQRSVWGLVLYSGRPIYRRTLLEDSLSCACTVASTRTQNWV